MENNMASGQGDAAPAMTFDVVLNALKDLGKPVPIEDLFVYLDSGTNGTLPNNCDGHRTIIRLIHYGLFMDYLSIQSGLVTIGKAQQRSGDDNQDLAVDSSGSDRVIFHINSSSRCMQPTEAADGINNTSGGCFEIGNNTSLAAMNPSQVTLKNLYGSPSSRNVGQLVYTESSTNVSQASVYQMDPSGPNTTNNGGASISQQCLSNMSGLSTTGMSLHSLWRGPNSRQWSLSSDQASGPSEPHTNNSSQQSFSNMSGLSSSAGSVCREWSLSSDLPLLSSSIAMNLNLNQSEEMLFIPALSRISLSSWNSTDSNQDTSDGNS
ncbi:hypothetical protein KR018_001773 [Drosophila ironensis]|nr:hypothetical protein KR018_001773 [Drosophila ironensis]